MLARFQTWTIINFRFEGQSQPGGTSQASTVTAEVAGSSPVVPAIQSTALSFEWPPE
jgi:hypothetical protein